MKTFLEFLKNNVEWLFSGIGIVFLGFIFNRNKQTNSTKIVAKNKSKVYNAGRDINYNDFSEFLPELKGMLEINLKQNNLLIEEKLKNLKLVLENLELKISQNKDKINFQEKLKEPDTVEFISKSVEKASLKGEKIDLNTLSSIISTRLMTDENLTELIYEQAGKALLSLTPLQVKQLGSLYLSQMINWGDIEKGKENIWLEKLYNKWEKHLDFNITNDTKHHFVALGLISLTPNGFINGNRTFNQLHENRYGVKLCFETKSVYKNIEIIYDENKLSQVLPTTVGQVIGLEYLRNFQEFNYINYSDKE